MQTVNPKPKQLIPAGDLFHNSYRPTKAEISLDAIASNAAYFQSLLQRPCKWMAVVKANGYGHGAIETAKAALEVGADYLGVAFLDEALRLRVSGIAAPILLLGFTPKEALRTAIVNGITLTVYEDDVMDTVIREAEALQVEARIHLKIETGMNRLGVTSVNDALHLARKTADSRYTILEGAFTHFANSDHSDPAYTEQQFSKFLAYREAFRDAGINLPLWHCCNSAAAIAYPHMHLDMVRVGISLFGLKPSGNDMFSNVPLKPAMRLISQVVSLKTVPQSQPIGYGCTYTPKTDALIATIPIGYADGLPRVLSNTGTAIVRGRQAPIAGRICMDQLMLDVTGVPNVQVGDEVLLFGSNKDQVTVDDIARIAQTIHYEVVCGISTRVPRVYVKQDRIISTNFI
ncbi:alanine racemase [Paenibacillus filicis]|uniref:Alanine racemase n=1 Tax=Paenibacillus gyeongsangnamensis TaxID=3388067 RepID=A0ABT4QEL0_9BACL|nr:alanine racemase [Paenibacillus filicis]MCZ8515248.1 alanine racemase [Paenibacillus filicis]